ncbi:MAG TPA: folate-binding protein [Alphaproteobacteria bacterium]|nr:folate-binding protein [Alphaproteobacteria bacterium]
MIRLGGLDRRAFLQGLISNDIDLCQPGRAIFAALLTPQGKFLHDMFIVDAGEDFLIDCEAARAGDLLKRFAAHKLRAKVTLADAAAEFNIWAGFSNREPEAGSKNQRHARPCAGHPRFLSTQDMDGRAKLGHDDAVRSNDLEQNPSSDFCLLTSDPRLPELGVRMIVKKGVLPQGAHGSFADYDRHRLMLGVADDSRDLIPEKSTLAEGNFDLLNGISWDKGCYMGQELTARMHYRGLVKKRLFPVEIDGRPPAFGTVITYNGEDIGEMRSSCGDRGLALLNVEKAEAAMREGLVLMCGESRLWVCQPGSRASLNK